MRQLIFVAVLSVCASATERPAWTWTCEGTICKKVELVSNDTMPQSLEECALFCDPYGNVWPQPTGNIKFRQGKVVHVSADNVSVQFEGHGRLEPRMKGMIDELGKIFQGQLLKIADEETSKNGNAKPLSVFLRIKDTRKQRIEMKTDESYVLQVQKTADGKVNVTITAPTYFGARHGVETLSQLVVLGTDGGLKMPEEATVEDRPVYSYRGILLDTARSFFPPAAIKRTIDAMAANKMNTFHWHMTDSHSFPFQSKTYPNFSRYGAYSPKQIYTADDIRSIVEYGRVRGVRILPEFDQPAHVGEGWQWVGENATVCFKAQPWTRYCKEPPCGQVNPTSEKVYEILGGLYSDFLDVFDSDIFHMGGDEVNLHCWKTSAAVTDWMKKNNRPRTEEGFMDLWGSFQKRAYRKLVAANGGKDMPVVLWTSELTKKGRMDKYLDKDKYIIQIWTTKRDSMMADIVKKGFRVIFSNYDALYLDCGFGAWVGEGNNWCSPYIGWQKVYGNNPVAMLTRKGIKKSVARKLTLGAEATLFSEQADERVLDGRLWPRASALAERLWSDPSQGWNKAKQRMLGQRERLVRRGIAADTVQPEWCRQNEGYCTELATETIHDWSKFRKITLQGMFPVSLTSKKSTGTSQPKWTEERKLAHSQKMKVFWAKKKQKIRLKSDNEPRGPKINVMKHLLFVVVLGICALAAERPAWTWTCEGTICKKVELVSKPQSLEECALFCDPYGNVWPQPTGNIKLSQEKVVPISADNVSVQFEGHARLEHRMKGMIDELGKIFQGQLLKTAGEETSKNGDAKPLSVFLRIKDTRKQRIEMDTDESYVLQVRQTADGKVNVTITAPTYFGARHGVETLSQLVVLGTDGGLKMPEEATVEDRPVYSYRGILLDTARSFFPPAAIKRTIDAMAANKMNTFHWHMTDSHSFPFQSKTYPNFSRYGAYSPKQIYTADDIRSIVEYGRVRGVRILPEFDQPAHVGEGWQWVGENATVCFKAQPWTRYCKEPPCGQLNPTSEKVYEILGGLYSDFLDVFDSDIFHMGGDEVNLHCWKTSAAVTDWMKKNNRPRTEEGFMDLWGSFQKRAYRKLVAANGGKDMPVVLWTNELTKKGRMDKYLNKDKYIIQIWTTKSDSTMADIVKKGFRVIFSNYDELYLDCGFGAWVGEGNNWCSPYIGWQKVYGNNPVAMLTKKGIKETVARKLTLGAEATLFSEQADERVLDGRLWPRAAALAERLWSDPSQGWNKAEQRMLGQRERLVRRGIAADTVQPEWCRQNEGYCK